MLLDDLRYYDGLAQTVLLGSMTFPFSLPYPLVLDVIDVPVLGVPCVLSRVVLPVRDRGVLGVLGLCVDKDREKSGKLTDLFLFCERKILYYYYQLVHLISVILIMHRLVIM